MRRLMPWRASSDRVLAGLLTEIDARIRERAPLGDILSALAKAKVPVRSYFARQLGDSTAAAVVTLKILNVLLAKYHFLERSTAVRSLPFGLLVDPANGCNLACPGCVQSTRAKSLHLFEWGNGLLPVDRFAALLRRYGCYLMQIMFCNYGEPLVNPSTPQLIEAARHYFAQTALSTNLSLPRFDAEAYIRSGLDFMYLAIDGATQEVYSKYRKNGDIAVVYRNVESLVAAKRRLGKRAPILRWQFLAFEHNAHEIPKAMERAKELGVDQFAVETPFDVSWDDPAIHPSDVAPFHLELTPHTEQTLAANWDARLLEGAAEIIEREFECAWTRATEAPAPASSGVSVHTCNWLYKSITMDANGRILPCCGAPTPANELVFGTFGNGLTDDFNSPHYLQARRYFADQLAYEAARESGAPAPHCANCKWDQEHTEFGPGEAAQYLRTVSRGTMGGSAIEICTNW
jgi:MoaA/NifB/PqqE/SkfB family radical SAM enzyme